MTQNVGSVKRPRARDTKNVESGGGFRWGSGLYILDIGSAEAWKLPRLRMDGWM